MLPPELDPAADPGGVMAAAGRSSPRKRTAVAAPSTLPAAIEGDERAVRLQAIGQLSQILFAKDDPASAEDRRRWLERWRASAAAGMRSEPLAAFYHAGQPDAVSELAASWLNPSDPTKSTVRRKFSCWPVCGWKTMRRWRAGAGMTKSPGVATGAPSS